MADSILQRVVLSPKRGRRRLYYRENPAAVCRVRDRRTVVLPRSALFRTDTFFNAFYESYWRKYTSLQRLALRLRIRGEGVLRLFRRSCRRERILLHEVAFAGEERKLCLPIADAGDTGLLYFEVEARSAPVAIRRAEWVACAGAVRPIRLAIGICTFNRAGQLLGNLKRIFADRNTRKLLQRVYVVDQGSALVRDRPAYSTLASAAGNRLKLLEQANRGGAGGFTRCLLEAQDDGEATHVLLMDDDIILEPESIARAAAFLSLARSEIGVGGHMLDRTRPRELVESGSRYFPERLRIDEPRRRRVDRPEGLTPFLKPEPRDYSGWWFFAFPLAVLERVGLPLPLFLRGDDVEFGCRLLQQGIPTTTLPGVAVWHEPFESKSRSWQPFFELRNLLLVAALHYPHVGARTVARQFFSRLLDELLTYDYGESRLMCEAARAYLRGPSALVDTDLHDLQSAKALQTESATIPRDGTLPPTDERSHRPSLPFARWRRWRFVVRNLLQSSPAEDATPQRTLRGGGEQWYDVADVDVVAVEESHRSECVVLRRSRGRFVRLLLRGAWLAVRLLAGHSRIARAWRTALPTLISRKFWNDYLRRTEDDLGRTRRSARALRRAMRTAETHPIPRWRQS